MVELSQQAINTIIGVGIMKTAENIFEHNDGVVTGKSRTKDEEDTSQG